MGYLTHDGFVKKDEGYEQTRGNWEYFLVSLSSYLETGKGTPRTPLSHIGHQVDPKLIAGWLKIHDENSKTLYRPLGFVQSEEEREVAFSHLGLDDVFKLAQPLRSS